MYFHADRIIQFVLFFQERQALLQNIFYLPKIIHKSQLQVLVFYVPIYFKG